MMSLCSAHLEEKHQWGAGIGVEDDLFLTNEEWTSYKDGAPYTGIPGHAIELATMRMYAVGVFTLGGFEKIVEVNCGHPDYVCFSPSGYNARRPRPRDGSARNIDAPRPAAGQLRHVGPDEQERAGRAPRRQPVRLAQVRRAEPPLRRQEGLQRPGAAGLGLPQPQRPRVRPGLRLRDGPGRARRRAGRAPPSSTALSSGSAERSRRFSSPRAPSSRRCPTTRGRRFRSVRCSLNCTINTLVRRAALRLGLGVRGVDTSPSSCSPSRTRCPRSRRRRRTCSRGRCSLPRGRRASPNSRRRSRPPAARP